jgi:hypothetical protein
MARLARAIILIIVLTTIPGLDQPTTVWLHPPPENQPRGDVAVRSPDTATEP